MECLSLILASPCLPHSTFNVRRPPSGCQIEVRMEDSWTNRIAQACSEIHTKYSNRLSRYPNVSELFSAVHVILSERGINGSYIEHVFDCHRSPDLLETCRHLREEGNVAFRKRNFAEALDLYLRAITAAGEHDKEGLSLSWGNISAVYYEMEIYASCLQTCVIALTSGLPDGKRERLIGRGKKAVGLLNEVEYPELFQRWNTYLEVGNAFVFPEDPPMIHEPRYGVHERLNGVSCGAGLTKDEAKGTCVEAVEVFNEGDIIISERPFAHSLSRDLFHRRCYRCLREILPSPGLPRPASGCSCQLVVFCSAHCRRRDVGHASECAFMDTLSGLGLGHLVARILLKTDLFGVDDIHILLMSSGAEYEKVYNLVTHFEDQNLENVIFFCLTAFLIVQIFVQSGFIEADEGKEKLVGGVLLRHLLQMPISSHAITSDDGDFIGSGIYPDGSLLNHSCRPNVISSFDGETLYKRAKGKINVGEEIFNCYGHLYQNEGWFDRRSSLKLQYFFDCECFDCQSRDANSWTLRALRCRTCGQEPLELPEIQGRNIQEDWRRHLCPHLKSKENRRQLASEFKECRSWISKSTFGDVTEEAVRRWLASCEEIVGRGSVFLVKSFDLAALLLPHDLSIVRRWLSVARQVHGEDSEEAAAAAAETARRTLDEEEAVRLSDLCTTVWGRLYGPSNRRTETLWRDVRQRFCK